MPSKENENHLRGKPRPLLIGSVTLANNLVMAPMAGITDLPFRALAKEGGAGLVCTEMVSATALVHSDEKTRKIMTPGETERPVSVQIFGSDAAVMAEAARIAEQAGADIVDINFGCPVRKIVKSGAGVKLVENQGRMADIMEAVVRGVGIPVTIKIRTGLTPDENIAPVIVRLAQESGIAMVALHGRPASAGHTGAADLIAIKSAVAAASIPVVGNGGITDAAGAADFLDKTGCSGLMIGRAAIGDPGLFRRIETYLSTGQFLPLPSWEERLSLLRRHAELSGRYYDERKGITVLRKVAPFYLKGLPNAAKTRDRFNRIVTLPELDALIEDIWKSPYFLEAASGD